jgi:hypothetical protein
MSIMYDSIIIRGIDFNNVVIFNFTHYMLHLIIFFTTFKSNASSMSNITSTIVISNNLFVKLALCMSWIVRTCKIVSSFNKCKR